MSRKLIAVLLLLPLLAGANPLAALSGARCRSLANIACNVSGQLPFSALNFVLTQATDVNLPSEISNQTLTLGGVAGSFQTGELLSQSASFTATISGTLMTVTAVASGYIQYGATITGTGISGTCQVGLQTSGTSGGLGTYTVSSSQSIASPSALSGTLNVASVLAWDGASKLTVGLHTVQFTPVAIGHPIIGVSSGAAGSVSSSVSNIDGGALQLGWFTTEPAEGYISNSNLDTSFLTARNAGKTLSLHFLSSILPNASAPWLPNATSFTVTMTSFGAGYTSCPTATFSAPTEPGGIQMQGTPICDLNSGTVRDILITQPGLNPGGPPPTVTFNNAGTGETTSAAAGVSDPCPSQRLAGGYDFFGNTGSPYPRYAGNTTGSAFVGSISGATLTVSQLNNGSIAAGQSISGLGIPVTVTIRSQLNGTPGGPGQYTLSTSPGALASEALYGSGDMLVAPTDCIFANKLAAFIQRYYNHAQLSSQTTLVYDIDVPAVPETSVPACGVYTPSPMGLAYFGGPRNGPVPSKYPSPYSDGAMANSWSTINAALATVWGYTGLRPHPLHLISMPTGTAGNQIICTVNNTFYPSMMTGLQASYPNVFAVFGADLNTFGSNRLNTNPRLLGSFPTLAQFLCATAGNCGQSLLFGRSPDNYKLSVCAGLAQAAQYFESYSVDVRSNNPVLQSYMAIPHNPSMCNQ